MPRSRQWRCISVESRRREFGVGLCCTRRRMPPCPRQWTSPRVRNLSSRSRSTRCVGAGAWRGECHWPMRGFTCTRALPCTFEHFYPSRSGSCDDGRLESVAPASDCTCLLRTSHSRQDGRHFSAPTSGRPSASFGSCWRPAPTMRTRRCISALHSRDRGAMPKPSRRCASLPRRGRSTPRCIGG